MVGKPRQGRHRPDDAAPTELEEFLITRSTKMPRLRRCRHINDRSSATAHKLARVLWHLLKYKQPTDCNVFAKEEEKMKRKKLARLQNLAASINFQLTPLT